MPESLTIDRCALTPSVPGSPGLIRTLHVLAALDRGGAETWLMDVAHAASAERLRVDVCTLTDRIGAYDAEFQRLGGRIHRCVLGANPWSFSHRLQGLLKREQYDIVHSHVYYFSGLILRAAAKAGVAGRVSHVHRSADLKPPGLFRQAYTRAMRRWIERYGTAFLGPSRASLEAFWGPGWEADPRKKVVYNGIRVERFRTPADRHGVRQELGLPSDAKIVLNVGRYVWHKRQESLVDGARELTRRRPDVYFVLIGDGPERSAVEEKVRRLDLADRFRFLSAGPPEIDRYWLAADVFVFPSISEGFGLVIAEAGAAGLPVVAADIPGVREAAAACRNITLLPCDSGSGDWASAVERALNLAVPSDAERNEMLDRFPFTIERSVGALIEVYARCLQTACVP